ncbi:phosphatase PAP2 family protein [Candidatus Pacearchaeota archaeon]|nr:phosphatase PAP2 family protein [Candidatus Pacearchaeota archaeon]
MRKKAISIFAFVVFVIFTSLYFDFQIVKGISLIRNDFFNEFFLGINFISSKVIIFFFLTGLFLWNKRKFILPLWLTLGFSVAVSFLLKIAVQRQRPFQLGLVSVLPVLEKASHAIWNFSFPSFQTMLVFSAVPLLSKKFPKLKYSWIAFAGLIGLSRVYFGLHFLSDVLVGGAIGYLIGWFVVKIEEEYKFGEKIWKRVFRG